MFVSSVSGRVATPMTGPYNASKFALEGLADSLRMELKPWGIRVVIVEPAQTDTDMWRTRRRRARGDGGLDVARAPRAVREAHDRHEASDQGVAEDGGADGEVAAAIERALTASRPRARYVVGAGPKVQAALSKVTPTPVMDAALRLATGCRARRSGFGA